MGKRMARKANPSSKVKCAVVGVKTCGRNSHAIHRNTHTLTLPFSLPNTGRAAEDKEARSPEGGGPSWRRRTVRVRALRQPTIVARLLIFRASSAKLMPITSGFIIRGAPVFAGEKTAKENYAAIGLERDSTRSGGRNKQVFVAVLSSFCILVTLYWCKLTVLSEHSNLFKKTCLPLSQS
eukprot:1195162-Prorocentrum_minimum.AAC.2